MTELNITAENVKAWLNEPDFAAHCLRLMRAKPETFDRISHDDSRNAMKDIAHRTRFGDKLSPKQGSYVAGVLSKYCVTPLIALLREHEQEKTKEEREEQARVAKAESDFAEQRLNELANSIPDYADNPNWGIF